MSVPEPNHLLELPELSFYSWQVIHIKLPYSIRVVWFKNIGFLFTLISPIISDICSQNLNIYDPILCKDVQFIDYLMYQVLENWPTLSFHGEVIYLYEN